MKVTIWNENLHEQSNSRVTELYPGGIHGYLKTVLECDDIEVRTATLDMPEHGLTEEVLADTDVLLWWGSFLSKYSSLNFSIISSGGTSPLISDSF